jgi:hypothetical protein
MCIARIGILILVDNYDTISELVSSYLARVSIGSPSYTFIGLNHDVFSNTLERRIDDLWTG